MDLPEYQSQPLNRSPLTLVASQINFEEIGHDVIHPQAREFQRLMGEEWSQLQSAPQMTTTMTPAGVVNEPKRQAYRLATANGLWTSVLNPESIVIETRGYTVWAEFSAKLTSLFTALAAVFDPATEQRLGLRYVNQLPLPEGRNDWSGLLHESLLGLSADGRFADGVLASDQRVMLQLDEETRCIVRHGQLPEGGQYLLDFDVFRENRRFDPETALNGAERLHHYVGRLFMACITDTLHDWLRG